MSAYYNEIDPFAAQWLRNLISAGCIAPGDVDERSIVDVRSSDLAGYTQCHFFAGIGGWSLALRLAGWPDDRPVWTGSCPCQPFSLMGKKLTYEDERHLWPIWFNLVRQCRPSVVLGEQVASSLGLGWLDTVQTNMESENYAFAAFDLCAAGVGAPHIRQRLWWVAYSERNKQPRKEPCGRTIGRMGRKQQSITWNEPWSSALSRFRAMDDGFPRRVAATDAARNAIVPQIASVFVEALMETIP